jgi:glycosyltransferase involved in cell wall biosynthesis
LILEWKHAVYNGHSWYPRGLKGQNMTVNISIVVPVYLGAETLAQLVEKVLPLTENTKTQNGNTFIVEEMIFVHDCGPDRSDVAIEELCSRFEFIKAVWLSKNFGQHPATVAGMASSRCEWVVTLDEDLQHEPSEIGSLLDLAFESGSDVVYGIDQTTIIHGLVRSRASSLAKAISATLVGNGVSKKYSSFRLIRGNIARGVSAYVGDGVYLDVALTWVTDCIASCEVRNSLEKRSKSGYTYRKLFSHFLRLLLSNGTKPLRIVTVVGTSIALLGIFYAIYIITSILFTDNAPEGWTSIFASILIIGGLILMALGVIAEYLGFVVRAAFGKPSYFVLQNNRRNHIRNEDQKGS